MNNRNNNTPVLSLPMSPVRLFANNAALPPRIKVKLRPKATPRPNAHPITPLKEPKFIVVDDYSDPKQINELSDEFDVHAHLIGDISHDLMRTLNVNKFSIDSSTHIDTVKSLPVHLHWLTFDRRGIGLDTHYLSLKGRISAAILAAIPKQVGVIEINESTHRDSIKCIPKHISHIRLSGRISSDAMHSIPDHIKSIIINEDAHIDTVRAIPRSIENIHFIGAIQPEHVAVIPSSMKIIIPPRALMVLVENTRRSEQSSSSEPAAEGGSATKRART